MPALSLLSIQSSLKTALKSSRMKNLSKLNSTTELTSISSSSLTEVAAWGARIEWNWRMMRWPCSSGPSPRTHHSRLLALATPMRPQLLTTKLSLPTMIAQKRQLWKKSRVSKQTLAVQTYCSLSSLHSKISNQPSRSASFY